MAELSKLGQAALNYATVEKWYLFPILPLAKFPALFKDYYTKSSNDPEQITAWWREVPDANIGLDCGKSGLVAIDADSEAGHGKGHAGIGAPLAGLMLVSGGRRAWETRISNTPTGGEHYIFRALPAEDGRIKTDSNNFGIEGIDVRARGGYIVLPPSKVPIEGGFGSYAFKDETTNLLPLPRKLLSSPGSIRDDDGNTLLEATLKSTEGIKQGGRDNFLIAFAGKLVDQGLNKTEVRALIEAAYHSRCEDGDVPFTTEDFDRLTTSAMKWQSTAKTNAAAKVAAITKNAPDEGLWHPKDETFAIPAPSFLVTHTEPAEYIVESLFQRASVNMFMGPPKAGKSTLLRRLAFDVALGLDFLGNWPTTATKILYYTLQENKPHLRKWLLQAAWGEKICELGELPAVLPIDFIFRIGHRGQKAFDALRERICDQQYGLVIIDMLGRFAGVESFDDYAENEAMTDALNSIAQDTNTCIIWSHHETKSNQGFAGAIGSQSIRGAVYTTLRNWKDHGRYYIATEQRDGDDVPATAIRLDPTTQKMRLVGSHVTMAMTDALQRENEVRKLLSDTPNMAMKEIMDRVGGKSQEVARLIERVRVG